MKIIILISTLLLSANLFALPTFFVDRFEINSASGNFIDEFDDGIIPPTWEIGEGTVTEANGLLTFTRAITTTHYRYPPAVSSLGDYPLSVFARQCCQLFSVGDS